MERDNATAVLDADPWRDETATAQVACDRPTVDNAPAGATEDALGQPKIAIVDDQSINIKIIQKYLRLAGYERFVTTTDAREAVDLIGREQPDVVLLDLIMPHVDGLEILGHLRRDPQLENLPIIVVTATTETETKIEALRLGATDFLNKPVDATELQVRVRNALLVKAHHDHLKRYAATLEQQVAARTAELEQAHREVVQCLAVVGEYRDNETGHHTLRVGSYAEVIAQHLGLGKEFTARLRDAAALHDIGKVAIPDSILLKPGKLDDVEFALMRRHCEYGRNVFECRAGYAGADASHTNLGREIVRAVSSPIMRMAAQVAYTHHERWDGAGYPEGLKGREIPIEGRITALADVFDALTSQRPYKPAFPLDHSLDIIAQGRGTQFDPDVVDAFFAGIESIIAVYYRYNPDAPDPTSRDAWPPWLGIDI